MVRGKQRERGKGNSFGSSFRIYKAKKCENFSVIRLLRSFMEKVSEREVEKK